MNSDTGRAATVFTNGLIDTPHTNILVQLRSRIFGAIVGIRLV